MMQKNTLRLIAITFMFLKCVSSFSQELNGFWKKNNSTSFATIQYENPAYYNLNLEALKASLVNIGQRGTGDAGVLIPFPSAQGELIFYDVHEASVLSKTLQEKYPELKSYEGVSTLDPHNKVRFNFSQKGIHATFFNEGKSDSYIVPVENNVYVLYERQDIITERSFECGFEDDAIDNVRSFYRANASLLLDGNFRTYRLALACTGEYAQYHLTDMGVGSGETDAVKKAAVLSAMVTTMTRVNGVLENELSMTLELISNNEDIIYLDPSTDPYTNGNGSAMQSENQTTCDNVIGTANYDVGHVFGQGFNGGIANWKSACDAPDKAEGVTGLVDPKGDVFDIDYATHEFGHQFGATHTFNNSCGGARWTATAVESGSGSTIMGYAGTCSPNVQNNSDPYFHIVSLEQIATFLLSEGTCSSNTISGNSAPTISSIPDYTIPKSTPFVLRGNGSDVDGTGTLTYCWEQTDIGNAGSSGVVAPPSTTATAGAVFRSNPPVSEPNRYMPAIETVIAGEVYSTWEAVPAVARDLKFNLTVRDNDSRGGRYAIEEILVAVEDVDPFLVSYPNAEDIGWNIGATQEITWEVGATTNGTINCQNVNIKLSTDGGNTFPITLLANTPNDGTEDIVVPNQITASARIMVEAADNIFYDMSNEDFLIGSGLGDEEQCFKSLSIFPNPSDGIITISCQLDSQKDPIQVYINDMLGKTISFDVFNVSGFEFQEMIDYSHLASGIYVLNLVQGGNQTSYRIIIN